MKIDKVGVVGAGMMGSEIALVMALAGKAVRLTDRDGGLLDKAMAKLGKVLDKGIERGFYQPEDKERALANLTPTSDIKDFSDSDMVIEAVFEDEEVKAEIFRQLDSIVPADCILSSNTSSISITVLSSYVSEARRAKFLGTHFFSPVSRMALVEVIAALDTAPETIDVVMALAEEAGKTPVKVKDVVGFAVNRLIHTFWIEATRLVEEGVATPEDIDTACKLGMGLPIGPFRLMDAVTNNLTLDVQEILHEAYGPRFMPRPLLKQMVKAGYNGRRDGKGWYRYDDKAG
ncbi:MAG: 3-hydroxyacyl-CoA dehydrogenase family protein [Rhodospirillaceae bacterium]|nr:3-hydroxyacyl-CoA dehydrogenase family protein [Rhodospirillaceae bacterium]MBT5675570.1 3-hydroxyacyl-CoA dehydrogenase family protein [Rhodospirillaceae bacterium]MBT7291325.1 3-hydroxyacyl-CoA dehydrogenase family protein [Rhodospirillaceae bacterium]